MESLTVNHGAITALRALDLAVRPGEVVAVMGRNGAGKTTVLRSLVGLGPVASGRARVGGHDPQRLAPRELARTVGLVPSDPGDLLWAESVHDECADADRDAERTAGSTRSLVHSLAGGIEDTAHPRDLSEGQRLALALSVVLTTDPRVLLLDEPTRGLDYEAKEVLVRLLRERAASGHTVVLATHDVELVAEVATRVVVLADGEVVADGPTREIVTGSPQFAPQVAKIMAPLQLLTVHDVGEALAVVS
jgi:energy-coupling factor transport system ATP-binding protein